MIAPVLADVAVTSARRLLHRRSHRLLVASLLRRQPVSAARELPGQPRHREGRGSRACRIWQFALAIHWPETRGHSYTRR
jgi:hypothetical protein